MVEPIGDATNITGISALVNRSKVDQGLDLALSETKFIGSRGGVMREEINPEQEFSRLMDGIYGKTAVPPLPPRASAAPTQRAPAPRDAPEAYDTEEEPLDLGDWDAPEPEPLGSAARVAHRPDGRDGRPSVPMAEPPLAFDRRTQFDAGPRAYEPARPHEPPLDNPAVSRTRYEPPSARPDDGQRDPILAGVQAYGGSMVAVTTLEREAEEEDKQSMLESIEELRSELRSMNIDVSRIPEVNRGSSVATVKHVYEHMLRKYDRARCDIVGSDIIVAGAQLLGAVLDGSRGVGAFRPNLDGWHNTIRPKLRRNRYEVSTLTSNVLRTWGIGPAARLAIELVPSAFIYSNMRAAQTSETSYTEDQMASAYDELAQFE
jgi:hypothetical protein